MKIYLFLKNKIMLFQIPNKVSGSFNFDENDEEEAKLINIEERNGIWTLYSTNDVKVINSNQILESMPLRANSYYLLQRGELKYLIYVTNSFDNSFTTYKYSQSINLTIGNTSSCNVLFNSSLIDGVCARVYVKDNMLVLDKSAPLYVNNVAISSNPYIIKSGDEINLYGLKMIFLNGFLLMNNPLGNLKVDLGTSNLELYNFNNNEQLQNYEVRDIDLYKKEDYYSKSPRVRRIIKTKEINLSPPPRQTDETKMPLLLVIGPMLTMGVVSGVMLINNIGRLMAGTTTLNQAWPSLVSSSAMLISTFLWPTLTRKFNKILRKEKQEELNFKYNAYLEDRKIELQEEEKLQREILNENLLTVEQCLQVISTGRINFWDKRIEQSDFLESRIGKGNVPMDVKINYPEEGFTVDEDMLRKQADALVYEFEDIRGVPIGYSFYKNKITALMGENQKCYGLINNIILQFITFYSYEDVKIVVFTNDENESKWDYLKYLNHSFSNDKSIRFFSTNSESAKNLSNYLNFEIRNRQNQEVPFYKPYYVVITDDYSLIKRHNFAKILTETDDNLGFSLIIIESQMSKLPSKCNNFIQLGTTNSYVLTNAFEEQKQISFHDEINNSIDMMQIVKKLSNIPIEFEEGNSSLPESISFLEMEKVGKVEQLNILNRWDSNDSTTSLKSEIGVDEFGNIMYLDLHEKFHGPHGLIAGMTGSGKSEFIITYILSMAINYSPDDVSFILIDYKGGGLAFAFENKAMGISLPHLAGTITNLDKAEMDRTLVSIDSEIKRRQKIFNEARDMLGESTIDIYKYQRFFKEGKLKEPVPHLFIICDEFAELKVQQPDFMDNLISVARIGRSLGVHLILATQKPSGVVNDQIWSNTKFRVCLKVQDESDSKEMLKKPDAASLKQTGRFYLQVGYDEYFALGQSAWCGAKYYPSEKIVKQVDKSVNFINDIGNFIKSIQASNNIRIEPKGEQLQAIMQNIIEVSNLTNKKSKRLWLNDIDKIILIDNLEKKYNFQVKPYEIEAIVGEYDAPEKQEQGLLTYKLNQMGNTAVFGNDEAEREKLVNAIVYSICKNHTADEINIYAIDYGSESLRNFNGFPQFGGTVFIGEDERFRSLFKLINEELRNRKKILINYSGSIETYNNKSGNKMPQILFIINNYEAILESYNNIYEEIISIGRDCERYGIKILLTCDSQATLGRRVAQCFENKYALHLNDQADYYGIFNLKSKSRLKNTFGRGLANNDGIHEFQTASIVDENTDLSDYVDMLASKIRENSQTIAVPIPSLPDKVTLDIINKEIVSLEKVPIGISKDTLKIVKYDFKSYTSTMVASNKLKNINSFMDSLLDVLIRIPNLTIFFIDTMQMLPSASEKEYNGRKINYFNSNLNIILERLVAVQKNPANQGFKMLYVFYGLEKLKTKIENAKIEALFDAIKESENSTIILADSSKSLKSLDFEAWLSKVKNNTDGIWIGKGFSDQQIFRVSKITKEMSQNYPNNYGFVLKESSAEIIKFIEFNDMVSEGADDDEE